MHRHRTHWPDATTPGLTACGLRLWRVADRWQLVSCRRCIKTINANQEKKHDR